MRLGSEALLAGLTALGAVTLAAGPAAAQTIKIGFISSYSGLNANLGEYMVGGQLPNVELETVATALKDPWKALQKK